MPAEEQEPQSLHEPVMLREVLDWLRPERGGLFVDCTLGLGGHAAAMLAASEETRVVGIDRDRQALELASERLAIFEARFSAAHASFDQVADVLDRAGIEAVDGMLADLGVSSMQLDRAERGFSFATDAPLDMRMDASQGRTAADLVNGLAEKELADLIFAYGEERGSRRVARAIAREREREAITTTRRLADIVVRALRAPGRWRIHPATRTFQALRIAVNDELGQVERFIPAAIGRLAAGGRLAVISFHSLEDRIVKRLFQLESGRCQCSAKGPQGWPAPQQAERADEDLICSRCGARRRIDVLTRKPVRPSQEEVERNPRARSAMLRVCERLPLDS